MEHVLVVRQNTVVGTYIGVKGWKQRKILR